MNNKTKASILGISGLLIAIVALIFWLAILPPIVRNKIREQLVLKPENNDTYSVFLDLPVPIKFRVWAFEIDTTNFDYKNINTMKYTMKGPYVYDETRKKIKHKNSDESPEFSADSTNITFYIKKVYTFNKDESCKGCKEDDMVTIYNIAHGSMSLDFFLPYIEEKTRKLYEQLTLSDTMSNLLFKGSKILFGNSIVQNDNSRAANFTVNTGKDDISQVLQLLEYSNVSSWDTWKNNKDNSISYCNKLHGTDGTQFSPETTEDDTIWIYEPLLCTSLYAQFTKKVTIKDVDALRFAIPPSMYEIKGDNACYCLEDDSLDCLAGMLNLRQCGASKGTELFANPAFFYNAPKHLKWTGLDQIKKEEDATVDNYASFIDVEPNTGIALHAFKKLMLSVKVNRGKVPLLANLTDKYQVAPIFYIEEEGKIDDDNANKLKDKLSAKKTATIVSIVFLVIGLLCIIASAILHYSLNK